MIQIVVYLQSLLRQVLFTHWAIPIIIRTPPPPVEEPWNFQGRGCINLGISRGEGALTLEFPGKGAFRIWNSKGRSNSHMEFLTAENTK